MESGCGQLEKMAVVEQIVASVVLSAIGAWEWLKPLPENTAFATWWSVPQCTVAALVALSVVV